MKSISFFLGSGFSRRAGFPISKEMNKAMQNPEYHVISGSKLEKGEHSKYIEEAKKIYELYPHNEDFDYEQFYDYLQSLLDSVALPDEYVEQKLKLKIYFGKDYWDNIRECLYQYSLQIASQLSIDFFKTDLSDYDLFINSIKNWISKGNKVNIFTLNHDLLLEYLFNKHKIDYSDGFTTNSNDYYYKTGNERNALRIFNCEWNNTLRLLKLHGSIGQYRLHDSYKNLTMMIQTYGGDNLKFIENEVYSNKSSNWIPFNRDPEFITGKKSKKWYSTHHFYYSKVIETFSNFLHSADSLIFIGYSFNDDYLHREYFQQFFNSNKEIFIIGNKLENVFLKRNSDKYHHIKKYLQDLNAEDFSLMIS